MSRSPTTTQTTAEWAASLRARMCDPGVAAAQWAERSKHDAMLFRQLFASHGRWKLLGPIECPEFPHGGWVMEDSEDLVPRRQFYSTAFEPIQIVFSYLLAEAEKARKMRPIVKSLNPNSTDYTE